MLKRLLVLGAALAATAAFAQGTPDRASVIAEDPPFAPQVLWLADIPAPAGETISLFNGRDLADWDTWLGYRDPAVTYQDNPAQPIGAGPVGATMFSVVEEDGAPAIRVDGATWGSIVNRRELSNYHLRLQYKWSGKRHAPRLALPENNGLLYHSNGEPGSVYGTWMPAVEFEIMTGSTGMVVPVGTQIGVRTFVGQDRRLAEYPHRRYMVGGREIDVAQPAWNVENGRDAEHPVGVWNTLDLYVLGDRAIHVVNGVPVMEVHNLTVTDRATGERRPLTSGRIQFQSEGAETFFRNIQVTPIASLPRIVRVR